MFRRLAQLWNNSAQSAGWDDPLAELLPVMWKVQERSD